MISVNNISVEFSARPIFKDISFVINPTDKIALVGKNGAGKSTLLKIIAGLMSPSLGQILKPVGINIGYLPQQMKLSDDTTLLEETKKVFRDIQTLQDKLDYITVQLNSRTDYDSEEYSDLLLNMSTLQERIDLYGISSMQAETERILVGLGFSRNDFNRPTKEFSGGWRMRVELAKILLQRPDVLLLDEPTNHLDIESIQWLEQFLAGKAKAVVLVSHDRAFLDNVTKRTIEISCGKIYDYKTNYSHFKQLRAERIEQQRKAFENQQKQISDLKDFIERFRYKPTKSNQVQSRIKQLEKIVPIEIDQEDTSHLHLKFPPAERSGDFPLKIEGLTKHYDTLEVFNDACLTLRRGDKVAFVGKNGEGKSTMVKCIMGETPFEGEVRIGHNVKIGYFAQNQAQLLDEEITVFDTIDRVATGAIRTKIRDILGAFMFGGEASEKKVKVLSGGEKTRLAMIKLLLEPVNFLILDEPTNHLDMLTKDILKEAVKDFTGTVIIVSHDREFLDGLVDKVYEFGNRKVKENLGGISDFLKMHNLGTLKDIESTPSSQSKIKETGQSDGKLSQNHTGNVKLSSTPKMATLSYAEQKERDRIIKKAKKNIEASEAEISDYEAKIASLEEQMSQGESSLEILDLYQRFTKELENSMSRWELAQLELEELETKFNN